ncbi:hypothetical protein HPB48_020003 [Haemaphysalis longicornis]|uniref:Uncharacterized protein n=1 Tax=Haemaphysalis longicornis TaxID=44386 RepID=A0A9J6H0E2_HAELO|nr:hypothetical protein HPB48_020003 [Haemaphysalis longicornis]
MVSVIAAAIGAIFYYITVLAIGVWGGRRVLGDQVEARLPTAGARHRSPETKFPEDYLVRLFVANRNVPLALATTSMTVTWVGGGYLSGTAEIVFNRGLLWAQAPLGYALSLVFGGMLFAGRMRATESLTMLDPFQQHYGPWVAVPLSVPAICGDVFWTAAILCALGDAGAVITNFYPGLVIVATACVAVLYTSLGSLFSVLHTDAFQMIGEPHSDWVGKIEARDAGQIIDQLLMTTFGGIPWQVYFQRVLSADTVFSAKLMSYLSAIGCIGLTVPPAIIGAASKSANFTATGYPGPFNLLKAHRRNVLPYAMRYFAPGIVSFVGLLGITAAVLSSVDSSLLSAGTLITRNFFQFVLRPHASNLEMCVTLRVMICSVAIAATAAALRVQSVFDLWKFSSDLVYVLLFPQFVGLFYLRPRCNAYGVVLGFVVGLGSRLLCGEPVLGIPVLVELPLYDVERGQQFPFRTLCMLASITGLLVGSSLAAYAFRTGLIPRALDVFRCLPESQLGSPRSKAESTPAMPAIAGPPSGSPETASPGTASPGTPIPGTASPAVVAGDGEVASGPVEGHRVVGQKASSSTIVTPADSREGTTMKSIVRTVKSIVKSPRSEALTSVASVPSNLMMSTKSRRSKQKKAKEKQAKKK